LIQALLDGKLVGWLKTSFTAVLSESIYECLSA